MSAPLVLPTYSGPAPSWGQVDWVDQAWTSQPATGAGVCTLTLPQLDSSVRWRITRAVVSCTSTQASQVRLYRDGVGIGNLRSGSNSGNYDEADYPCGLQLPPSSVLVAVWTNASTGAVGTLAIQADVLRLAGT